jgi:hypothetical protein
MEPAHAAGPLEKLQCIHCSSVFLLSTSPSATQRTHDAEPAGLKAESSESDS